MRKYLPMILCLLSNAFLFSQNPTMHSDMAFLYKIDEDQFKLYNSNYLSQQISTITSNTPIDTLPYEDIGTLKYSFKDIGVFLLAYADHSLVRFELIANFPWVAQTVFYPLKGGILVLDSLNNPMQGLDIRTENERLYYNSKSKLYLYEEPGLKGKVLISNGKMTEEMTLDAPYRWDGYGGRGGRHRWKNKRKFKGFIAFNKPVYKPGDTLKLKAYICKNNGRPYTKPVNLRITESYYTQIFSVKLDPVTPGAYLYEFVIHDSLKIDKNYIAHIDAAKNSWDDVTNTFNLEDYKLDEAEYSLAPLHYSHYLEDSLYLQFEAYDKNHNQMFDAEVDILCRVYDVDDIKKTSVYFPDTMFMGTFRLADLNGGIIQLPSELKTKYPANYRLWIEANFRNSNNELKSSTDYINIIHEPTPFNYYISSYHLKIAENTTIKDSLTVRKYTGFRGHAEIFKMHKNDSLKIDRTATAYTVEYDGDVRGFQVSSSMFNVDIDGEIHVDTLMIWVTNPTHIPLNMYYMKGETKIPLADTSFQTLILNKNKTVKIYCEYFTGGSKTVLGRSFILNNKNIWIKHNLPDKVYPGEDLDLTLTASNYKNDPLENTNLTVFSINSAFEDNNVPNVPDFGKLAEYAATSPTCYLEKKTPATTTQMINSDWINKFGLQKNVYYQMLLSNEKIIVYREPNALTNGAIVKITGLDKKMYFTNPIYAMEKDSVVYYNASEGDHIYTGNGKHVYKVRFDKFYYTTPEIQTYKDSITYVVIKTDLLKKGAETQRLNLKKPVEMSKIAERFLVFEPYRYSNTPFFISNSNESYCIKDEYYYYGINKIIGPFKNPPMDSVYGKVYKYNEVESFVNSMMYNRINNLDYYNPLMRRRPFGDYKFPFSTTIAADPFTMKDPGYLHQSFETWQNFHYDKFFYFKSYYEGKKFFSDKVHLLFPTTDLGISGTILKNLAKDSTYFLKGMHTYFYNLDPGAYRIIYVNNEQQPLIEDVFLVKPNSYLVKDIDTSGIFFQDMLNSTFGDSRTIQGRLIDAGTEEPIMYASITLLRNDKPIGGFTSDLNGYFSLKIPPTNGTESIRISCIGYETKTIKYLGSLNENDFVEYKLTPSLVNIDDITIITGGITAKYNAVENQTNGAHFHRYRTTFKKNKITFRTTEVPDFTDGDWDGMVELQEVTLEANINRVSNLNGIVNTTTGDNDLLLFTSSRDEIQSFDDEEGRTTGFGYVDPEIVLNANAIRTFFADNAIWQPNLLTNKNGSVSCHVKFPENITSWSTYILAMHPDGLSAQMSANTKSFKPVVASLYLPDFVIEGDSFEIVNKVMNYTAIPVFTKNKLIVGNTNMLQVDSTLKDFLIYKKMLYAGPGDSIKISFASSLTNGYLDGEKRVVPVYKKGIDIHEGKMFATWKNTSIKVDSLDKEKEVEVEIYNGFDELVIKEADYMLFHYKHWCNEQISSKLITAICAAEITTKGWKKELYEIQIENMLRLLRKNQNDNGGWSWWNKEETDPFMTLKVAEALKFAQDKGYVVKLKYSLTDIIPELLRHSANGDDSLAAMKVAGLYNVTKELVFDDETSSLLAHPKTDYQKLLAMEIRQLYNEKFDIGELMSIKKETLFGSYYWGTNSYYLYDNATYLTASALEIMTRQKVGEDTIVKVIGYMMEKRMNGHFANTMASAKMALFFHNYVGGFGKSDPVVIINKTDSVVVKNSFHKMTVSNVESIDIKTDRLIYVGYSQIKPLAFDAVKEDFFSIKNEWLQDGKPVTEITSGKFLTLHTTLVVKKDAQYMSFEIPIPAGCTYAEKNKSNWYRSYEVHREYFKDRIVIYYKNLPTGTYELNFKLEPRFKGSYTVNNALMENMYFPQLNGYNAMQKVKIK